MLSIVPSATISVDTFHATALEEPSSTPVESYAGTAVGTGVGTDETRPSSTL